MENNMKLSDAMRGRLVLNSRDVTISNIEKEYIKEVVYNDKKIKAQFENPKEIISSLELIDRNFYYDIYKFSHQGLTFCLKFGELDDIYLFKKEFDHLKKIKNSEICPTPIIVGKTKQYAFFIMSYEFGFTLKDIGSGIFMENIENFGKKMFELHNCYKPKKDQTEMFLDRYFALGDFKEVLDIKTYQGLKKIDVFNKCEKLLTKIKKIIRLQLNGIIPKNISICHTNLTGSNVLTNGGKIKFCNFQDSFHINPLWDLGMASIKLGISDYPLVEERFLKAYDFKNFKNNNHALVIYKEICSKLVLYELVCIYFYKLLIPKEDTQVYKMLMTYERIRPVIHNEFTTNIDLLDTMFGDFNNI